MAKLTPLSKRQIAKRGLSALGTRQLAKRGYSRMAPKVAPKPAPKIPAPPQATREEYAGGEQFGDFEYRDPGGSIKKGLPAAFEDYPSPGL